MIPVDSFMSGAMRAVGTLFLVFCTTAYDGVVSAARSAGSESSASNRVSFLAAGRQGYGDEATRQVALSMEAVARDRGNIDFILLLGDNFYPSGVTSVDDPQWVEKFESLYDGPAQSAMPFYVILGNHDHQGDVTAQLDYARNSLGSGRWNLDAPFYTKDFGEVDGRPLIRVVFLDSVRLWGIGTYGPLDVETLTREDQLNFIREAFASGPNDPHWKIVASHYSFRSKTRTKYSRMTVMSRFLPVLKEASVDLVISANDRFQQILDVPGEPLHVGTNGGGRKIEEFDTIDTPSVLTVSQRGFASFSIDSEAISVELLDAGGTLTFQRERRKRP